MDFYKFWFLFALFSIPEVTPTAQAQLSDDVETLKQLILHLETSEPLGVIPRQDDDDEDATLKNVFPGVASIILGVAQGDLRKIFEDGIFSFLGKNAATQAFAIFHNLLGRTTQGPTTEAPETTEKARTKSTTPGVDEKLTKKPTIKYRVVTRGGQGTGLKGQGTTPAPLIITTTPEALTTTVDPEEEGEEYLVARFEKALLPFLPSNPEDALPVEIPEIVSKRV